MLTFYFRNIKDEELKEVDKPCAGVWAHAVNPSEEEFAALIKDFSLDEDIIEDAKDFYEVPRMEKSGGATYIFTRYSLRDQSQGNSTAPLLMVMGESYIVTIAVREIPLFKKIISGEEVIYTAQKSKFLIMVMDIIT